MDCNMPGFPVLHHLLEFAQTHVLWVSDVIQPYHPLLPSSLLAFPHSSVGKESTYSAGDPGSIPGSGRSPGEGTGYPLQYPWASHGGGSNSKEYACNVGDEGSISGLGKSPGGGHANPLQYSCLENPMDRSLVGYSPWDHRESDTTEWLSTEHTQT